MIAPLYPAIPVIAMVLVWILRRGLPAKTLPRWAPPVLALLTSAAARLAAGGDLEAADLETLGSAVRDALVAVGLWETGGKPSERMMLDHVLAKRARRSSRSRGSRAR